MTAAPERVLSSVGIILHHADNGEVWIEDASKDPALLQLSLHQQVPCRCPRLNLAELNGEEETVLSKERSPSKVTHLCCVLLFPSLTLLTSARSLYQNTSLLDSSIQRSIPSRSGFLGILLDLDHTTIYGQDGNDLSIAFQLNGLDFKELCNLYKHLINPQVKDLLDRVRKLGYMFQVALYTR
eukprot:768296-Hanusia_phi.AAC.2